MIDWESPMAKRWLIENEPILLREILPEVMFDIRRIGAQKRQRPGCSAAPESRVKHQPEKSVKWINSRKNMSSITTAQIAKSRI